MTPPAAIRLGVMVPMTGVAALYGPEIARAAQIAAEGINRAGGVLGRPLELLIADDGSLPESAVPVAHDLVDRGCAALVGNLMSNTRLAVVEQVAAPRALPLLNFSFYEGSIDSPYFFHFAALPNQQIEPMITAMAARYGPKMYFAGNNYEWPRGSIDAAVRFLTRSGGESVGEDYLPLSLDEDHVEQLLDRVAHSGADVFVPYFAGSDQVAVLRELHRSGLRRRLGVAMGHFDAVLAAQLDPAARAGLFVANTYFMSIPGPESDSLLAAVSAAPDVTGLWPDGDGVVSNFGEGAYVCIRAFSAAVTAAGDVDPDGLRAALAQVSVSSAQGEVTMDPETRHAVVNTYLARCDEQGRLQVVESFGRIAPSIPLRYRAAMPRRAGALPTATAIRHDSVLAATSAAIVVTDLAGTILYANAAGADLFGFQPEELAGRPVRTLLPPAERADAEARMLRFVADPGEAWADFVDRDVQGYRKDGSYFPIEFRMAKLAGSDGVVFTVRDASRHLAIRSDLARASTHDRLTGLANRSLLVRRIDSALERAQHSDHLVAVLVLDIDRLKALNTRYGQEVGDALLREIAGRLSWVVPAGHVVARLEGDTFAVMADRLDQGADLDALIAQIDAAVREPVVAGDVTMRCSVSGGIAISGAETGASDLIRQADLAMVAAQEQGPGAFRYFNVRLQEEAERRSELSQQILPALERGEFWCAYQPVIDTGSGAMVGAELLLRWDRDDGPISPAEFIPVAESSGAIISIGAWVLQQGCRSAAQWRDRWGDAAPWVSVNVSPRQFADPGFPDTVGSFLAEAGVEPDRIVLEVTESGLMGTLADIRPSLERVVKMGVRVAVDDFGTGHSSLAELISLPVSVLKIDRSFVQAVGTDTRGEHVLAAIVALGRTLGMATVAEGVEDRTQLDLVRRVGCSAVQGFLLARPGPAEQTIRPELYP